MNDLRDLLESELADLPKSFGADADHAGALEKAFSEYAASARALTSRDAITQEVLRQLPAMQRLQGQLLEALGASLDGLGRKAHDAFAAGLEIPEVKAAITTLSSRELTDREVKTLYRMRSVPEMELLAPEKMFHMPYDMRWLVGTNRYSAPGVPMLYCGASLAICWEEIGRPSLDTTWAVGVKVRDGQELRLLNLAYYPKTVATFAQGAPATLTDLGKLAVAYAVLWPLIAACSCRKPQRSKTPSFVVEYVLPQLLLGWLMEQGRFDGLRYFSTRQQAKPLGFLGVNFVFPARKSAVSGHCARLKELFKLTSPVSWQLAEVLPSLPIGLAEGPNWDRDGYIEYAHRQYQEYRYTQFYKREERIESLAFDSIA